MTRNRRQAILTIVALCLTLLPLASSPGLDASAASCTFHGTFDGNLGSYTNAGAASVNITANAPTTPCSNNGVYLWEMVVGPASGYAQGGWLIANGHSQSIWSEYAQKSGAFYDQYYAAPGGTHTYETQIKSDPVNGFSEYFYVDGTYYNSFLLDWWQFGTGIQYFQENHSDDDHWGPDTFSSTRYCTVVSGYSCNPTSVFTVLGANNGGPTNSYECYTRLATDSFKVYDTRDNGGHC